MAAFRSATSSADRASCAGNTGTQIAASEPLIPAREKKRKVFMFVLRGPWPDREGQRKIQSSRARAGQKPHRAAPRIKASGAKTRYEKLAYEGGEILRGSPGSDHRDH